MTKPEEKKTITKLELEVEKEFEIKQSMLANEAEAFVDNKAKLMMSPKNGSSGRKPREKKSEEKQFNVQMVVFDENYDQEGLRQSEIEHELVGHSEQIIGTIDEDKLIGVETNPMVLPANKQVFVNLGDTYSKVEPPVDIFPNQSSIANMSSKIMPSLLE